MLERLVAKPASAVHSILEWSKERPAWQRDALRRIIVNEEITQTDLDELERLCRSAHGADSATAALPNSIPLDATHLPPAPGTESSVSLKSVKEIENVNRLAKGSFVSFGGAPGLTIVFGENGTGKSGYVRILKKACRARGAAPEIRHNVFEPSGKGKATAKINAVVGPKELPVSWVDGTVTDPILSNVFVFDTVSATNYLQDDESASFTPFGLDILPTLSRICDAIALKLKTEMESIKQTMATVSSAWKIGLETKTGRFLNSLSANTSKEEIDALSLLTEEQKKRITILTAAVVADPIQKSKETRAASNRIRSFLGKLKEIENLVNDTAITSTNSIIEDSVTKKQLAEDFKKKRFDDTFLKGTGSELWRNMWNAAQEFSEKSAYKEILFPNIREGAKCVLCQQDLESLGSERLAAFDRYCKDRSQSHSAEADEKVKTALNTLEGKKSLTPELNVIESDLVALTSSLQSSLRSFVEALDNRLSLIQKSLREKKEIHSVALPLPVVKELEQMIETLDRRAETEESAGDIDTKAKLKKELEDLEGSKWLADTAADVLEQINRMKALEKLHNCLRDVDTAAVTRESTTLTKTFVSDAYCARFARELEYLGLNTLKVNLVPIKGKKGETKFGLRIIGAESEDILAVASEGEQRCISIGAFLAELSQASHQSTLIFDDPVSSLDHTYRERVAARLVQESKERQVVVFTHDVVFLSDLQSHSKKQGLTVSVNYLEWGNGAPGSCHEGLPWELKSVADRFDILEKMQRVIKKDWNPVPNDENKKAMHHVYSLLRATLERIVEKEILCDTVFRFRSYVDVSKLYGVIGFTSSEYEHLEKLVRRCHEVTDAHDPASGKTSAVPNPDELANDIAESKAFVDEIKKRRKDVENASKVAITTL